MTKCVMIKRDTPKNDNQAAPEIVKKTTNEIVKQHPDAQMTIEQQWGVSLEGLSEEAKEECRKRMANSLFTGKEAAFESWQDANACARRIDDLLGDAEVASQNNKHDFVMTTEYVHKDGSGKTNVKIASVNNTSTMIIVLVVGIAALLLLSGGC